MRKQAPAAETVQIEGDGEVADEPQASAAIAKEDDLAMDIEAEIAAEVKDMRKPTTGPLFTNVKVEVQCGMFTSSSTRSLPLSHPTRPCACTVIFQYLSYRRTFSRYPIFYLTNRNTKYSS